MVLRTTEHLNRRASEIHCHLPIFELCLLCSQVRSTRPTAVPGQVCVVAHDVCQLVGIHVQKFVALRCILLVYPRQRMNPRNVVAFESRNMRKSSCTSKTYQCFRRRFLKVVFVSVQATPIDGQTSKRSRLPRLHRHRFIVSALQLQHPLLRLGLRAARSLRCCRENRQQRGCGLQGCLVLRSQMDLQVFG